MNTAHRISEADAAGRPAREGELIQARIDPPFLSEADAQSILAAPLTAPGPGSEDDTISVGADGVALFPLAPTLETGRVVVNVRINEREIPLSAWLAPSITVTMGARRSPAGKSVER